MRVLFLFFCIVWFLGLSAQDVIVKKDGSTILSKVTKVGDKEIEYKKFKSTSDRLYSISTSEVMAINYEDGEKDIFNSEETPQKSEQSSKIIESRYVKPIPANNNQQIIDIYKSPVRFAKTPSNKDEHYMFPIMTMSDSSIVSTSDIEMKIIPTIVYNLCGHYDIKYSIELQNKTDDIVYVDLANTFRIFCDGTSQSYFNTEQTTVNHGSSSGVGFNMGGLTSALGVGGVIGNLAGATTIGGSSQHSVSTTYSNQRILAIPPHSKKDLSEYKQVKEKRNSYITISDLETYGLRKDDLRGVLKKNGYISYSENESPYTARYIITYSTNQDFSNYSSLYAKLYARYIYGEFWGTMFATKREEAIKEIQQYIPNFWEDQGIIVGKSSYISKKK